MSYFHRSEVGLYPSRRFDYDGSGKLIYDGFAYAGADENSEVWLIRKFEYDGSDNLVAIKIAEGKAAYIFKWVDRTTYNYL